MMLKVTSLMVNHFCCPVYYVHCIFNMCETCIIILIYKYHPKEHFAVKNLFTIHSLFVVALLIGNSTTHARGLNLNPHG